jgi:hypothetical protein
MGTVKRFAFVQVRPMRCVSKDHQMKDEALKLAKAWFERNTYGDEAVEVYEAIEQALAAPAGHRDGHWCVDLTCKKCYSADFRFKHTTPLAQPAPDLQAELDATNRQVEILSDALAESRREVAALKAVQEPVAQYTVDVSGAAEPSCEPLNWHKTAAQPAPVQATMKLESSGPGYGPAPKQKLSVRHVSLIDEGKTSAQPAVPDAIGPNEDELPAYAAGWNDCRQTMLEILKARGNT